MSRETGNNQELIDEIMEYKKVFSPNVLEGAIELLSDIDKINLIRRDKNTRKEFVLFTLKSAWDEIKRRMEICSELVNREPDKDRAKDEDDPIKIVDGTVRMKW